MIGVTTHFSVVLCSDGPDAAAKGYDYNKWSPTPKPLNIEQAVVVQRGTEAGHSTVDLILIDEDGNRYTTMVTGRLLSALPLT